jgi:predicted PurR-regulated permease PerM
MSRLEDKIVNKVFEYETSQTKKEMVIRVLLIVAFAFITGIFGFIVYSILDEQSTFDILQIFSQDSDIISQNIGDVFTVLSYEIPKFQTAIFILSLIIFFILLYIFVLNIGKISRKIRAIINYKGKKINTHV